MFASAHALRAANRDVVAEVVVGAVDSPGTVGAVLSFTAIICAMFFPNLSLSVLSSFSFRFIAPGLLFRLFILILPSFSCPFTKSSTSGNASASPSNVVLSFLFGRLRFRGLVCDFSIRERNAERLIEILSFFELMNESEITAPSRCTGGGRAIMPEPD